MIKRWLMVAFATCFALSIVTGCSSSNEISMTNEYNAETDFPFLFASQNGSRIASSDQGYYMLNGSYLYYMDKQSVNPVLLDNRPDHECMSEEGSANCNAYVSLLNQNSLLLQQYKGKLYTIEFIFSSKANPTAEGFKVGHYELVRRDLDGSNRKVLKKFSNAEISQAAIHRNHLYFAATDYDKDGNSKYELLRLSLDKPTKTPELLYIGQYNNGSISRLIPYGAQLYFLEWPESGMYSIMRYDLATSNTSVLWEQKDGGYPNLEAIKGDKIYLWYYHQIMDRSTTDLFDERSLRIYASDLNGANVQETDIPASPIISNVYMDDRYTYVRPVWFQLTRVDDVQDEMKIYKDGKLAHTVDTSKLPINHGMYTGDERYMFIQGTDGNTSFIQILDKNKIESGDAAFELILETPTTSQGSETGITVQP